MDEAGWVEVVYADADRQVVRRLPYEAGLTAAVAVDRARIPGVAATDDGASPDLGVWGRPVSPGQLLSPGDRVEVYRPLRFDPKEERRRRAGVNRRRAGS